jgi:pilus assembly protein Flp/PilA
MFQYIQIVLAGRLAREEGASAVEYALLVAGIAAVAVPGIILFGHAIGDLFTQTCLQIQRGGAAPPTGTVCQ